MRSWPTIGCGSELPAALCRIPCLLLLALAGPGCEFLANPSFPTSFDTSIEVVANGAGTEYSIDELFPDDDGNRWLYFLPEGSNSRWMTWRTQETVELNGRKVPVWKQAGDHETIEGWMEVTDQAVLDFGTVKHLYPCSIPRLHAPVSIGKAWRTDCLEDGFMAAEAVVLAMERVRTDVGWVDALRVEYTIQNRTPSVKGGKNSIEGGTASGTQTWWFSPGIGVVKRSGGSGVPRVLRHGLVKGKSAAGDMLE